MKIISIDFDGSIKGRIDQVILPFFQKEMPELTRNRLQSLINQGDLRCAGEVILKSNQKATAGTYFLTLSDPITLDLKPVSLELDILYDDDDVIVVNKPPFLSVHPGAGHYERTLVHGLLYRFKDSLSGIGGVQRPGIVHRLDKDTSGLMVIAKHDAAHHFLSTQFESRTLSRTYIAFVFGRPSPLSGRIHTRIGRHPVHRQKMTVLTSKSSSLPGKEAITDYKVLKSFHVDEKGYHILSMVECTLQTGRTHQIRVHMQHLGCPIIGDATYGKKTISSVFPKSVRVFPRQALHAHTLSFLHPRTKAKMTFQSDLPKDMEILSKELSW